MAGRSIIRGRGYRYQDGLQASQPRRSHSRDTQLRPAPPQHSFPRTPLGRRRPPFLCSERPRQRGIHIRYFLRRRPYLLRANEHIHKLGRLTPHAPAKCGALPTLLGCLPQRRIRRLVASSANIYVTDPEAGSVFVITAYELRGKALAAYRRRKHRRKE